MKRIKASVLGLLMVVAAYALAGCETATSISWQRDGVPHHQHPEQEWWHYQFVYHPNAQVYFEPYTKTYYWFEKGSWCAGAKPPTGLELNTQLATVVKLQQSLPFVQHDTVLAWHPCKRQFAPQYDREFFEQQRTPQPQMRMAGLSSTDRPD